MTSIGHARQAVADAAARAELYRLWHAGQRMGATHPQVLEMMGPRTASALTEQVRRALLDGTRQRRTIASIVRQHAALLQPFERALLSFGEEAGSFEQALATLAAHFKAEHRLLARVWSKLTYPLIVSLVFVVIAPLPLVFMGRATVYWSSVVAGLALWYLAGGSVIAALAATYANRRDFVLARLARLLAGGIEAGLPLDRVVELAVAATSHPQLSDHVRRIPSRQLATQPLSETFAGCPLIPAEMRAAIKVAEVSGDFSGALRRLADLYDGDRR